MRLTLSLLFVITAAVFLISVPPLRGQVLRVAASPAVPGGDTRVVVWLDGEPAKIVLGLQMEIQLPSRALVIDGAAEAGEAAKSAGKMATCSGHWDKAAQIYTMKCIVAGGRNPIGNGPVVVVKGKISPEAKPGNHTIKVDHALAVDAGLRSIPMKSAEAPLTVTRK
jgi:hypothetical protein